MTTIVQGDHAPEKRQKMLKKIREHIHEDRHPTIHELADTVVFCQEILTEN
jgi:hypothetical protein